jgi:peptidoglycan/LPS O-acetylase OafA/YrhL
LGTLRLILALSVAYTHAGAFFGYALIPGSNAVQLIPGDTAVQAFYVISGFYMALVLNEKYRPVSTYLTFISNRILRLFPAYAVVVIATLLMAALLSKSNNPLLFDQYWKSIANIRPGDAAFLFGSQAAIWGVDFYPFLMLRDGSLVLTSDFKTDPWPLQFLLVIPPAWSLGVELWFYLVAPFLVRRAVWMIAAVIGASMALRMGLQFGLGWHGDPWSYRFFPSELGLFLIGALAYRVYRNGGDHSKSIASLYVFACVTVAAVLLINNWGGVPRLISVGILLTVTLALPMLFRFSRRSALDRLLGELSYPVYICHFMVRWAVEREPSGVVPQGFTFVVVLLLLSAALYWAIDRPIDAWRQRRFAARA